MAKIKHNNFLDTVHDVFVNAQAKGILHLYAEGREFTGRKIRIRQKDLFHFGTTGYLGLEQDWRLKNAAMEAIYKYGTQFPLSKSYVSHPLYETLEEKLYRMYGYPVVVTKNSTLGHQGVIPTVVADGDAIILDHQVHWSVQTASNMLKTRNIPVEMIRHNNLEMLEHKIKVLSARHKKIWYMADGVYSMYGDVAPIQELMELSGRYPQLYLYFDDVHGMSWTGKNGTGYVLDILGELPENVLLFGTLSKTFGASGSVFVCSNKEIHHRVKTFGGPLTFSAQLEPASVAAAIASSDIHLSPEIHQLQNDLYRRIDLFNSLLEKTALPLIERNDSPVFYIGTGMPGTGYDFVNRMTQEGFFVNLGLFPAVPVKNTGVRITISKHNDAQEIKGLVEAMAYHYPKSLEANNTTLSKVKRAFRMPVPEENRAETFPQGISVQYEGSIKQLNKSEWNGLLGKQGIFDWDGLLFLEETFSNNEKVENNWSFHYFVVRDEKSKPVICTFFTAALWKDDMLAPISVSVKLEEKRKEEPYYLTSDVLGMGSLLTEGNHCFIDKEHPLFRMALDALLKKIEILDQGIDSNMVVLRDFEEDEELNDYFHQKGFTKINMPDSCRIKNLSYKGPDSYMDSLSPRSRRHFRKEVISYEAHFEIRCIKNPRKKLVREFYKLYEQVREHNLALNTFSLPEKLFQKMSEHPNWEFIVVYLKKSYDGRPQRLPVGVMFCYMNLQHTYVPALIGMDYHYTTAHQIYRQLLYQTIKRAGALGFKEIDFGMTASFEKKKMGAEIIPKLAYLQAKDNFKLELMGVMQEASSK